MGRNATLTTDQLRKIHFKNTKDKISLKDLANQYEVSIGTLKSALSRARKKDTFNVLVTKDGVAKTDTNATGKEYTGFIDAKSIPSKKKEKKDIDLITKIEKRFDEFKNETRLLLNDMDQEVQDLIHRLQILESYLPTRSRPGTGNKTSPTRDAIIKLIKEQDWLSYNEIAEKLNMTFKQISGSINAMPEGMIQKIYSPEKSGSQTVNLVRVKLLSK